MTAFEFPHPKDKLVLLKRIPVFTSCTDRQLLLIADRTRLVEYKKGEFVFREGDEADAFYIVVSGRLRVFTESGDGEVAVVATLHNSDSFGEMSLLTGETHSASIHALNDTLVLRLAKEEFEEVINTIPALVLHLSRTLSRRLRMKQSMGEFTEATIAAIYSAVRGIGRTLFARVLAGALRHDTDQAVIVVDMNPESPDRVRGSGVQRHSRKRISGVPGLLSETDLNELLDEHALGFHVLSVGPVLAKRGGDQTIAPLLNMLTKRYSYILIDLPTDADARVLKALAQADLVYLMTDQHQDTLARTKTVVRQLQDVLQPADQRVKLVVNRMPGIGLPVSFEQIGEELHIPVAHALPRASSGAGLLQLDDLEPLLSGRDSPYVVAVHRIGRELSGSLVGLALGSGAALGLAHIGVLKVLEREKIHIDMIAGSSIGGLIGGLWASGVSADEMERMASRLRNHWDIARLFFFDLRIPTLSVMMALGVGLVLGALMGSWIGFFGGFAACLPIGVLFGALSGGPIQGAQLMALLQKDFQGKSFEDTWLPLRIVAANPMTREEIVFDSGSIAEAVRASVSIPGIFKPVIHRGRICLDGGVANPVPVSALKQAGVHRVIAVNVFPTTEELVANRREMERRRADREAQLASRSFPVRLLAGLRREIERSLSPLFFDVIMRSMQSMEFQIAEVACHEADLTMRPTVPDAHWLEFFNSKKFIRRGEEVALERLAELKRVSRAQDPNIDNP